MSCSEEEKASNEQNVSFQNENLKTEDGSVSNAAPDVCIAYKLHLECGRLINLYDWMEARTRQTFVSFTSSRDVSL